MPVTTTEQRERWQEIVCDPALRDLPYEREASDVAPDVPDRIDL